MPELNPTANIPQEQEETWKPVVNYEGLYEVSMCGRVRRVRYVCKHCHKAEYSAVKVSVGFQGYLYAALYKSKPKKRSSKQFVHRLVALAFLGIPADSRLVVNHKDLDRANAHLSNLEWVTCQQNTLHAHQNGRAYTKLNTTQVDEIRQKFESGQSRKSLCAEYDMSPTAIYNVTKYDTWKPTKYEPLHPAQEHQMVKKT